jgi:hypothetical protein
MPTSQTRSQPSGVPAPWPRTGFSIGAVLFFVLADAAPPMAFCPRDCGPRGVRCRGSPAARPRIAAE